MASNDIPNLLIQCKICEKRYEDLRLLPCLHTYCKACFEQSVQTHNGTLCCPVCLNKVTFSDSNVKNLRSNFMVSDRLQNLSSQQLCEGCEGVTATSLCIECSDFLCSDCVEEHKRVCLTKNHLVISINADATFKPPICAIHTQELMFCKQCKKPVCSLCDEHDELSKTPLEEAVNDTQSKINTLLKATQAKIPILQGKLGKVNASKEKLDSKVKQVNEKIKETFERISMAVGQRKEDLCARVSRIHDQKSKELESNKNDLKQVSDSCDFAEKLKKSDNKAMVLHAGELTCARLRDLSRKEDDAVKEIAENGIEYIFEQKPVLNQLEKCGYVLLQPNRSELNGTFPCGKSGSKTSPYTDSGTVEETRPEEEETRPEKETRRKVEETSNNIPDKIQCKICEKPYEDPKLLPCLHTYCKACLEQSVQTHNGALYCPVCPTEIASSEFSGVDNLHSNFMVSDRLQNLSSRQCKVCEKVTATSLCFECSDFLCSNCVEEHKRVCLSKNHLVVSTNANSMFESLTCAIHTQEALRFCQECKKPVCKSCDQRYEHSLISLEEAVNDTKSKINTLLIAAQAKTPKLEKKLSEVRASKEKLESKVEQVNKEIKETFERILMAAWQRQDNLHEKVSRIHDQKSKELESKKVALEKDLAQVSDSCDFAKKLKKSDNKAMVLHTSELTCARLRDLSEKEDDTVPEIAENGIAFIVEEKPVLDQLEKCGDVLLQPNRLELNGTFRCDDKRCANRDFIESSTVVLAPKDTFLIKHKFTCASTNLIYCISCSKCPFLYIGETEKSLKVRFGKHRSLVKNSKKHDRIRYGVVEHFTSEGHDMKVRALLPCPDEDETRPEQEETFSEQEETFSEQEETFSEQEETFSEQEETFSEQEETFSEQEETFSEQEETFSEQEETFSEQEETFSEQEETFSEQEETSSEREKKRRKEEKKRRKQEETRLIVELGTLYPSGLNKKL